MNIFEIGIKTNNEDSAFDFSIELGLININNRLCSQCNSKIHTEY